MPEDLAPTLGQRAQADRDHKGLGAPRRRPLA
jgi:hypothetical protein